MIRLSRVVAPVPPFATGRVPVTLLVKSIVPANIAFVMPPAFTRRVSELISILLSSTFTDREAEPPKLIDAEFVVNPEPAVTVRELFANILLVTDVQEGSVPSEVNTLFAEPSDKFIERRWRK